MYVRPLRFVLSLATVVALHGCSDQPFEPHAATPGAAGRTLARLECVATVRARKVACAVPRTRANTDIVPGLLLGGQGTYVQLRADSVAYDTELQKFSADISVQNLTAMDMGTDDSRSTVHGVNVFLTSGPFGTGGTVTVDNPAGYELFTAPAQPYFHYDEILDAFGGTSDALRWQFGVPAGVETFIFTVMVHAPVANPEGALRWSVEYGLGAFNSSDCCPGYPILAGSDPRNIFAFTPDDEMNTSTIDRFNGVAWNSIVARHDMDPTAAWVGSPRNAWMVGEQGLASHYNGVSWSTPEDITDVNAGLNGVWGFGANNAYAVGNGIGLQWDGETWEPISALTNETFNHHAIFGTALNNIWVVGSQGSIRHFDGAGWQPSTSNTENYFTAVFAAGSKAWAVGYGVLSYFDGAEWHPVTDGIAANQFRAVHGAMGTVIAVGYDGVMLRWDPGDETWKPMAVPPPTTTYFSSVLVFGPNDIWAVGSGSIEEGEDETRRVPFHWDGTAWTVPGTRGTAHVKAIHGADGSVWAVGDDGLVLRNVNNGGWQPVSFAGGGTTPNWRGVWAYKANDVWLVGACGAIAHWNGTTLTPFSSPTENGLNAVFGFGDNNVYAVSDVGVIYNYDGESWSQVHIIDGAPSLKGIWGISPSDIWVAASGGIARFTDGVWSFEFNESSPDYTAVHGTAANNVVLVGRDGLIHRWNGTQLNDEGGTTSHDLFGIFSDGTVGHTYIVGEFGTVLRKGGETWTPVRAGVSGDINTIWMSSSSNIYIGGTQGWISRGSR